MAVNWTQLHCNGPTHWARSMALTVSSSDRHLQRIHLHFNGSVFCQCQANVRWARRTRMNAKCTKPTGCGSS